MKKALIGFLVATTIALSGATIANAAVNQTGTTTDKEVLYVTSYDKEVKEVFNLQAIDFNQGTGKATLKIKLDKPRLGETIYILEDSHLLCSEVISTKSDEVIIPIKLSYYAGREITAYMGKDVKTTYAEKSNTINLGYFDQKVNEKIALSYVCVNDKDTNFNVILPTKDEKVWLYLYDNGQLIYRHRIYELTDRVNFTIENLASGRHDVKAYIGGTTRGVFQYEPFMTSNTVSIFK